MKTPAGPGVLLTIFKCSILNTGDSILNSLNSLKLHSVPLFPLGILRTYNKSVTFPLIRRDKCTAFYEIPKEVVKTRETNNYSEPGYPSFFSASQKKRSQNKSPAGTHPAQKCTYPALCVSLPPTSHKQTYRPPVVCKPA